MKRSLLLAFLTANFILLAGQVPEFFNYQAIVRNVAGQPVVSQPVSILFTIIKTNPSGTNVYSEKHSPVTNEFGLVTLAIGNGSDKSGDFTTIDWSTDNYFLNVKIDPSGGTTYTDMGTTQLLSVPYAMHAKSVANNDDADADPENELQDLTIVGFNLGITGGDGVTIPSLWAEDGGGIKYDGGKVLISRLNPSGSAQLELADIFDPGGKNLIIGDNAFLTDIDQDNSLGIYGLNDPYEAAINLGIDGPVLSKGFSVPFPGILDIKSGYMPPLGGIRFGLVGPTLSNYSNPEILIINNGSDIESGTIKLGDSGPTLTGTTENLSIDKKLNMNNLAVENVSDPVNSQDAATKAYVDEIKTLLFITTDASKLLDAGVTVPELLNAGVSVANLVAAGASAADLIAAGVSVADLLAAGVSVADLLAAGVSVADLLAAGVSVADLLAADANVADLLAAGVSVTDLFNAGVGVGSLEQNGVTSQELTDAGLIGTLADADGKTYKWIKIGSQIWMGENLAYLPGVVDPATGSITTSYYYVYGYEGTDVNTAKATANYATYGVLYNWPAAMNGAGSSNLNPSGVQGVCPTGWHLPSQAEWTQLKDYLADQGHSDTQGTVLKATSGWGIGSNGTDNYGFTGRAGGRRRDAGTFHGLGDYGDFWTATIDDSSMNPWHIGLFVNDILYIDPNYDKSWGKSIRCLKNMPPSVETNAAISIASTYVTLQGSVNANGLSTTVIFEYGTTTSYGSEITATQSPVSGTTSVDIDARLSALIPGTTYHFRVRAESSTGTAYGNDMTFNTPAQVSDADANIYNAVIISTQVWMAENLKTTKFNDGTDIPLITDNSAWKSLATPAYCWYDNNSANKAAYGALYNHYTVVTGKLCPAGWHVPSNGEWVTLRDYLGGAFVAGGKLKSITGWDAPNTGATNETGFTALPGGFRHYNDGSFNYLLTGGFWYSTSNYYWNMANVNTDLGDNTWPETGGFSVRCVKD